MAEIGTDIRKAKKLLEAGELVAVPTETVYGLAGNALNPSAVSKIFSVKNRPHFDPLIVHVYSLEEASEFVKDIPEKALTLARHFWPGPLTLVLPKRDTIPDLVTSGLDTVGIRSPDHPLTRELLHQLKFPLAAPSANPFGYVSPTLPQHVNEQLGERIPYILDGGACRVGIESTILGFDDDRVFLYRKGGLSLKKLESVIGRITVKMNTGNKPVAPGQLESHYAPHKPLRVGNINYLLRSHHAEDVGLLCFSKKVSIVPQKRQIVLSKTGNLEEAAQHLFSALRELDKWDVKVILAEEVPDKGIGQAINDRLRRAASA